MRYRFALVAPNADEPPRYTLYVESDNGDAVLERAAQVVEQYLRGAHHYDYCRKLGQLGQLRVQRVRDGWRTYTRVLAGMGQRLGNIKPTVLDAHRSWDAAFLAEQTAAFAATPSPEHSRCASHCGPQAAHERMVAK